MVHVYLHVCHGTNRNDARNKRYVTFTPARRSSLDVPAAANTYTVAAGAEVAAAEAAAARVVFLVDVGGAACGGGGD